MTDRSTSSRFAVTALAALLLAVISAAPAAAFEVTFELRTPAATELAPPPPPLPVQLVLDDDSAEGAFGVSGAGGARQFLWFNQFDAPATPGSFFRLTEIWVLFPDVPGVSAGDAIELVVYSDPDGDPTNGAVLLASYDETVQVADDMTFSVYALPSALDVPATGDVLIGVINRFVTSGVTPPVNPAAIDQSGSAGRSWFAVWSGDPPDPPLLPPDDTLTRVDDFNPALAGNWMIRGFGTEPQTVAIPTLGGWALAFLALLLAVAAGRVLRRQGGATR